MPTQPRRLSSLAPHFIFVEDEPVGDEPLCGAHLTKQGFADRAFLQLSEAEVESTDLGFNSAPKRHDEGRRLRLAEI